MARKQWRAIADLVVVALIVIVLLQSRVTNARGATSDQTRVVGPYRLELLIGPAETMLMQGQRGTGEVMLGGRMAACSGDMPGMVMSGKRCNHHVELHVHNARSGRVIRNARISITIRAAHPHRAIRVPIMIMAGQDEGIKDLHYGNNVYLPAGTYTVLIQVNQIRTIFTVHLK